MSSFGGSQKTLLKQLCKRCFFVPSGIISTELQREDPVRRRCWERCLEAPLGNGSLGRTVTVGGALSGGTSSLLDTGVSQRTVLMSPTFQTSPE